MSIFSALFGRRRAKLSEPESLSMFADGESAAGKHVTPNSAMQLSTAWSCVRLLSETIGTLPLPVFSRDGEAKQTARDHPLYDLLHDSPNADQSAAEFWEAQVACLCLQGNGYSEKTFTRTGGSRRVRSLEFLNPEHMTVARDEDGMRVYRYNDRGKTEELPEDKVFHLRGFGAGGDAGLSPISYARQTMGSALAAEETAGKLFANGLQQPLFIDSGQVTLKPEQRNDIHEMIKKFAGSSNAGKILVLEAGMKPVELSFIRR